MRSRLTTSGMSQQSSGSGSRQKGYSMSVATRPEARFCATRPRRASSASSRLPKAKIRTTGSGPQTLQSRPSSKRTNQQYSARNHGRSPMNAPGRSRPGRASRHVGVGARPHLHFQNSESAASRRSQALHIPRCPNPVQKQLLPTHVFWRGGTVRFVLGTVEALLSVGTAGTLGN